MKNSKSMPDNLQPAYKTAKVSLTVVRSHLTELRPDGQTIGQTVDNMLSSMWDNNEQPTKLTIEFPELEK